MTDRKPALVAAGFARRGFVRSGRRRGTALLQLLFEFGVAGLDFPKVLDGHFEPPPQVVVLVEQRRRLGE